MYVACLPMSQDARYEVSQVGFVPPLPDASSLCDRSLAPCGRPARRARRPQGPRLQLASESVPTFGIPGASPVFFAFEGFRCYNLPSKLCGAEGVLALPIDAQEDRVLGPAEDAGAPITRRAPGSARRSSWPGSNGSSRLP